MTNVKRKLTTILSADVQSYSRLMNADEEGTLALLKQYREAMERLIEAHGGRVVNTWGDGVIAEFPSVVEAVRAAVDTQNELAQRNALRPEDGRMLFRIGINLGDVIADGGDIYGDGVNIAARLQAQAEPGGIVISNTVYDQVRNKVPVGFDFLGSLSVKNISDAVPSYAVRVGDEAAARARPQPAHMPQAEPSPELTRTIEGLTRYRGRFLPVIGLVAAFIALVNLFTWSGEFWAAWPLLFLATVAALSWAKGQSDAIWRFAPPVILALMLVGINVLSWGGTA